MAPVLDVRNLRIEFPQRRQTLCAIDDVSFTIGKGEILGVVGESGAGKSLTGAAVIGLLQPPAGSRRARSCSTVNRYRTSRRPPCAGYADGGSERSSRTR